MKLRTIVCAVVLLNVAAGIAQERTGKVRLRIVDPDGKPVAWRLVSFLEHDREMVSRFHALEGEQIPYGSYRYEIRSDRSPAIPAVMGRSSVSSPETLVVIALRRDEIMGGAIDRAFPPDFVIRGKLEPVPKPGGDVWIRFLPLFRSTEYRCDVPVDAAGQFRIYDVLSGRYLMTVFSGSEVIDIQEVSFDDLYRGSSFVVKLADRAPSSIHVVEK